MKDVFLFLWVKEWGDAKQELLIEMHKNNAKTSKDAKKTSQYT